ncbi:sulfatase [Candidatus Hydrogenedentota bacterium]
MNIVYIGTDTWRPDFIGCYGNDWVQTPNIDRLAGESVTFTNAYADGLPTLPMRRAVFTGRSVLPFGKNPSQGKRFPWRSSGAMPGWEHLWATDVTFAETLKFTDYKTCLVADNYHLFKPDMNYHFEFNSWNWIRGQECDDWQTGPPEAFDVERVLPPHLRSDRALFTVGQYCLNTQDIKHEEDYFCAQTIRSGIQWLERNAGHHPFVLWLELFDPHEPWDAPERFNEMYGAKHPDCDHFLFAYGVPIDKMSAEEIDLLKLFYAAEITFLDMWIGRLLSFLEDMDLLKDTIVVFTSDHGVHLGEEGCIHKRQNFLASNVTQIPLMIRHPDVERFGGTKVDALVSVPDIAPTLLDFIEIEKPETMTGENMWPLATGEEDKLHEFVVSGWYDYAMIRTLDWHYFRNLTPGKDEHPCPCLYDLNNDRAETTNVIAKHPEVVSELNEKLGERFGVEL